MGQNPRRFYYAVEMSDGDILFFEGPGINSKADAREAANEDRDKQAKGAQAVRVLRHEITAYNRWQ